MFSSRRASFVVPGMGTIHGFWASSHGERDLSRCRPFPFCDRPKEISQGLIRFPSLRRKARDDVAEVETVERGVLVDLSREETFTKRAKRNEADPELLERRHHFRLGRASPQRVFALDCSDRLDCVCAADGLHSCFR
jgi:hypothetical protein